MSTTIVSLRAGQMRGTLSLERAPLYLRFVIRGSDWKTLDALDQPDDSPRDGEAIYAAVKVDVSRVHIDRVCNGRRVGEWRTMAVYELLPDQPPQSVMADWSRWQKFCEARALEHNKNGGTND